MGQRRQAIDPMPCDHDHAPAVTAVAAVGSAAWDVLFTPETDAPVTPFAGLDTDFYLVDKHQSNNIMQTGGQPQWTTPLIVGVS